jgi:hypothetical protein
MYARKCANNKSKGIVYKTYILYVCVTCHDSFVYNDNKKTMVKFEICANMQCFS